MTFVRALKAVGTALAGTVGAADSADMPPADPRLVAELLAEIGVIGHRTSLDTALRRFQSRAGLVVDGVAGPRTVHMLVRYAGEARELRELNLAA
jgi:murein L,D-transpeptidase YcbB/YkuD